MLKGNHSSNLDRQSSLEMKKPAIDSKMLEAMLYPNNIGDESRNPHQAQEKGRMRSMYATGNAQTMDLDRSTINVGATMSMAQDISILNQNEAVPLK
jgi:hypothetical protein